MDLSEFWETTPCQVFEFIKAARERATAEAKDRLLQAHTTAAFAAMAFFGKLPRVDSLLARFDRASEGPRRAQTRDEQIALLRSFVSKPEPQVIA